MKLKNVLNFRPHKSNHLLQSIGRGIICQFAASFRVADLQLYFCDSVDLQNFELLLFKSLLANCSQLNYGIGIHLQVCNDLSEKSSRLGKFEGGLKFDQLFDYWLGCHA